MRNFTNSWKVQLTGYQVFNPQGRIVTHLFAFKKDAIKVILETFHNSNYNWKDLQKLNYSCKKVTNTVFIHSPTRNFIA